jgi:hypothetical protein
MFSIKWKNRVYGAEGIYSWARDLDTAERICLYLRRKYPTLQFQINPA